MVCPICESGNLMLQIGKNIIDFKDKHKEVDIYYYVCDCCGSEQADANLVSINKIERS